MDTTAFEASCRADGYDDIARREGKAGFTARPHTHPFHVRAMVLQGEFTLIRNGTPERYGPGDTFAMEAGCEHAESFGPQGASYVIGKRHGPG